MTLPLGYFLILFVCDKVSLCHPEWSRTCCVSLADPEIRTIYLLQPPVYLCTWFKGRKHHTQFQVSADKYSIHLTPFIFLDLPFFIVGNYALISKSEKLYGSCPL